MFHPSSCNENMTFRDKCSRNMNNKFTCNTTEINIRFFSVINMDCFYTKEKNLIMHILNSRNWFMNDTLLFLSRILSQFYSFFNKSLNWGQIQFAVYYLLFRYYKSWTSHLNLFKQKQLFLSMQNKCIIYCLCKNKK